MVLENKCSYDKNIQYIGFTSKPLIVRVKEHLKGKTAVSDYISNCNICKNWRIAFNFSGILKERRNKLETLISEAILIERYNQILNKQLTKPGISNTLNFWLARYIFVKQCMSFYVTCNFTVVYIFNIWLFTYLIT